MTKTKRLNTRITEILKAKLTEYALDAERSESWVVEKALEHFLDGHLDAMVRRPMKSED